MAKYDKYICTELQKRHLLPGPTPEERDKLAAEGLRMSMEHVLWIDDEVIPGAYYGESTWVWPSSYPNQIPGVELMKRTSNPTPMFPHAHNFPELLSWWGTDPDHPEDTTTMGMLMEDEEIPLDRSWVAYIPAGMKHMPTMVKGGRRTTKPVCHWTSGPGGVYTREKDEKPAKPASQKEEAPKTGETKPGEKRNAKYMVFGNKPNVKRPAFMRETDPKYTRPMAIINEDIISKSFGAYIPPAVEQGPMIIRNITKQIFYMMSYPVGEGIKKYRGR